MSVFQRSQGSLWKLQNEFQTRSQQVSSCNEIGKDHGAFKVAFWWMNEQRLSGGKDLIKSHHSLKTHEIIRILGEKLSVCFLRNNWDLSFSFPAVTRQSTSGGVLKTYRVSLLIFHQEFTCGFSTSPRRPCTTTLKFVAGRWTRARWSIGSAVL